MMIFWKIYKQYINKLRCKFLLHSHSFTYGQRIFFYFILEERNGKKAEEEKIYSFYHQHASIMREFPFVCGCILQADPENGNAYRSTFIFMFIFYFILLIFICLSFLFECNIFVMKTPYFFCCKIIRLWLF